MNIFRTALLQAIEDILKDNGSVGRFGLVLTDEEVNAVSERVADLFEMTLDLRTRTSAAMAAHFAEEEPAPKPLRRLGETLQLPRKRVLAQTP